MPDRSYLRDACAAAECAVSPDRRRFLRESTLRVAAALVAVGMSGQSALAMPLDFIAATRRSGSTVVYAIPATDGAKIDKGNDVILVRWQGAVYAFNLSCPHQNTALRWEEADRQFQCPKHHSRFQPDGSYIPDSGRATRNMDRLAIAKDPGGVRVDVDKVFQEDTEEAAWRAAVVKIA